MRKFLLFLSGIVCTITGTLSNGFSQGTPSSNEWMMTTSYTPVQPVDRTNVYYAKTFTRSGFGIYSKVATDTGQFGMPAVDFPRTLNNTTNNWTGAVSNTWGIPGNWSLGVVADGNTDVLISSGTVIVNSSAVCKSLTILPGVIFTVNAGVNLYITQTGTNDTSRIEFSGKQAVFMGNSITKGVYASDNAHRWTSLFCAVKGGIEDNRGISGQTMQVNPSCGGTSSFDHTTIPTYDPATHSALFISLGINDVGLNNGLYSASGFKADYTAAVTYAIATRGWPANKIILVNVYHPFSWDVYRYINECTVSVTADAARAALFNSKIAEVAGENGCRLIDIYSAMTGLTLNYFYVDQLHPSDLGHAFIANYLLSVL